MFAISRGEPCCGADTDGGFWGQQRLKLTAHRCWNGSVDFLRTLLRSDPSPKRLFKKNLFSHAWIQNKCLWASGVTWFWSWNVCGWILISSQGFIRCFHYFPAWHQDWPHRSHCVCESIVFCITFALLHLISKAASSNLMMIPGHPPPAVLPFLLQLLLFISSQVSIHFRLINSLSHTCGSFCTGDAFDLSWPQNEPPSFKTACSCINSQTCGLIRVDLLIRLKCMTLKVFVHREEEPSKHGCVDKPAEGSRHVSLICDCRRRRPPP